MMACDTSAGKGRKMEEMDGATTIECLRGRLLAERTATKLARHEAQLMETKLIELEKQLSEEIEFKNMAEKKLTLLLNKLQSLKINYVVDEDSENCGSQVAITARDAEELRLKESGSARGRSENLVPKAIPRSASGTSYFSEYAWSTVTTNSASSAQICFADKFLDTDADDHINRRTDNELKSSKEEYNADNSLTVLSFLQTSSSSEKNDRDLKMSDFSSQTVGEALNALWHARKEIERSMERRRMVKAKWTQLILS